MADLGNVDDSLTTIYGVPNNDVTVTADMYFIKLCFLLLVQLESLKFNSILWPLGGLLGNCSSTGSVGSLAQWAGGFLQLVQPEFKCIYLSSLAIGLSPW